MLKLFFFWILFIIVTAFVYKILFPEWNISTLWHRYLRHISEKLKAKTAPARHMFDPFIYEWLRLILKDYSHPEFEIEIYHYLYNNAPCIDLAMVPKKKMEQEELAEICQLLRLKFEDYLRNHNLNWKHFVQARLGSDHIHFYIVYSELQEDIKPVFALYHLFKKEKEQCEYTTFHDTSLEKELENALLDKYSDED